MNWGKSIFWVFVAFASGILYLVYRATQTEFDLVEDDYYEKELSYQDHINQTNRSIIQNLKLVSSLEGGSVHIQINGAEAGVSGGTVWFYDAQNRSNDREINLTASDSAKWEIPTKVLAASALNNTSYELRGMWIIEGDTFRGVSNLK